MFSIIKKTANVWHHVNNTQTIHLSSFGVVADITAQTFILRALNGAFFPRQAVFYNQIQVIDETDSGTIETFANINELLARLIELQYPPYKTSGGGEVDSVNGQTGDVILNAGDVGAYTTNEVDSLLLDKFDNPTGNNTQYLDGAGVPTTFPSLTGFVPYTGANQDVNIGENKYISDKGFEIPTSDKGLFKVDSENPSYNSLAFFSTDTSEDNFGRVIITANPEEGINLIASNEDGNINNVIGINTANIQINVNDTLGNANSVVFEPTQATTNKQVSLPKTVFNSNAETAGEKELVWNDADGTLDLGLKGGNVTLQIGQESVIRVVNKTGANLLEANYQAVRVDGAQGNRLKIALAQATTDLLSAETIGLVTETINDNQEGFVTTNGLVRNINTSGSLQGETWADGDMLYLSPTIAGRITKVKPTAPNHLVVIGYVVRAHATQGQIFVKVDNGYELDELHNVAITSPANNNVLTYNSTTDVWENKTVVQALGYTPLNKAGDTITGNVGNTATGSFEVPSGTTAQRPATPTNKMIRYNTDEGYLETWDAFWGWMPLSNSNEWKRKWGFEYWNDLGLNNTFTDGVLNTFTRNGGLPSYSLNPSPTNLNWAGIQGLQTGPNANGQSILRTDLNIGRFIPFNSGRKSFETAVYLQNLSTSTDRFNLILGMSTEDNSTQNNGVVFIYDEGGVGTGTTASPNWQIITSNGGVRSAIVTSVVVNAQEWYKLRIETNENSTEIYYYINDILVRTETTNIPINRYDVRPVISITKTIGTTTRAVLVDYIGMKVKFNTSR